jgi:hypothetical protein
MKIEEIFEGYWKNIDIQNQEKNSIPLTFNILVDGKVWKKNGIPVEFKNRESAQGTADTITGRYNKTTQIAPVR